MSVSEISDGRILNEFVLAFEKMEGKYLATQIVQVLSHPDVYVFGELLELENIKKVCLI